MRKTLLVSAMFGGLFVLASAGAHATPAVGLHGVPGPTAATHVDYYYWNHHHWHHRRWWHNRWHYWD
jgi:hypothetical protein